MMIFNQLHHSQRHRFNVSKTARCKPTFSHKRSSRTNVAFCSTIWIYNGKNTRFYRVLAAFVEIKRAFRTRLTPFWLFHCAHSRSVWMYFIGVAHFNRFRSSKDSVDPIEILF